ncbi:hypothetical protein A2U01_0093665, partial [Trifolium medium]|nr:hypothetical protein [Trifolium medium]
MKQAQLSDLKKGIPSQICISHIKNIEKELDGLLKEKEQWWAQRAKANWLLHGDKNT